MEYPLVQRLTERVKELSALHKVARILQEDDAAPAELMNEIAELLPDAWQFPEIAGARIKYEGVCAASTLFAATPWQQSAEFRVDAQHRGVIQVCYVEERPQAAEGPFLAEERALIDSLAEMLRSFFRQRLAAGQLRLANDTLELQVRERTAELECANRALAAQVAVQQRAREEIESQHRLLRRMASELSAAEARERRVIASDLHDHIGHALVIMKMRLAEFQGNAIFCGFESNVAEMARLLNQTIAYTRSLTFEISPPVLYELGLAAAIEWQAEEVGRRHSIRTIVETGDQPVRLAEDVRALVFKSFQELLHNVVKHAGAKEIRIGLHQESGLLTLSVRDDGCGMDPSCDTWTRDEGAGFGLFSIRERLLAMGGEMRVRSAPGAGTEVTLVVPIEETGPGGAP